MAAIYKMDKADLQSALDSAINASGTKNILPVFCENIAKRVKSKPLNYLMFGCYWWPVKKILAENGYDFGEETNQFYVNEYTLDTPELTLLEAWNFADMNRDYFSYGTREFDLDTDGESTITLFDKDMEIE